MPRAGRSPRPRRAARSSRSRPVPRSRPSTPGPRALLRSLPTVFEVGVTLERAWAVLAGGPFPSMTDSFGSAGESPGSGPRRAPVRSPGSSASPCAVAKLTAVVVASSASLLVVAVAVAAPTASFTVSPSSPTPGEQVIFSSTSTTSPGRIANYAWDLDGDRTFGEPGEPAGATATTAARSFPVAGESAVRLRVIDDAGRQDVASRVITVREVPPPAPPLPPTDGQAAAAAGAGRRRCATAPATGGTVVPGPRPRPSR